MASTETIEQVKERIEEVDPDRGARGAREAAASR